MLLFGVLGVCALSTGTVLFTGGSVFGRAANPMPIPAAATTIAATTIAISFRKQVFRNISSIYPYQHGSIIRTFKDQIVLSDLDNRIQRKVALADLTVQARVISTLIFYAYTYF